MAVTQLSTRGLRLAECINDDAVLSAAGAVTYAEGTILGRITASGYLTHYASGASDGSQVPVAVLSEEQVFTGAGTRGIRAIVSGQVRQEKLVMHGVGAVTTAVKDLLRSYGIIPLSALELGIQES